MNVKAIKNCLLVDLMSVSSRRMPILFLLLLVLYAYMQIDFALFIVPYLFAFFPFVNEEKGVTALYFSPVGKKDVVRARYVYCLLLLAAALAINAVLVPLLSAVTGKQLDTPGAAQYLGTFALYSILISILLPLYFKYSYSKCQFSIYLIIFGFVAFGVLVNKIPKAGHLLDLLSTLSPLQGAALAAAIGVIMLAGSLRLSVTVALNKDL